MTSMESIAENHSQYLIMEWDEQFRRLQAYFHERDYHGVKETLEVLTEIRGWRATIEEIASWIRDQLLSIQSPWEQSNPLYTKVRDGLFHVMGLESVVGLDIDQLKEFSRFNGFCLRNIRVEVQRLVIALIRNQLSTGNTFHIDTAALEDTAMAFLLPEVVETRTREILALSDSPHLNDVVSTYYGFTILTTVRDFEEGRRVFQDLCRSLGKEVRVRGQRISYRTRNWDHCRPTTQELLLNMTRMALTKTEGPKVDAAKKLGVTGDSRARRVLTEAKYHTGKGKRDTSYPKSYYRDELEVTIDHALKAIGREMEGERYE